MKILYVTYHGGSGGVSVLISDLVRILVEEKGVTLDVCYASHIGRVGEEVQGVATATHCLEMRGGFDLMGAWRLVGLIRRGRYDLVHLHYFTPALRIATWMSGVRPVVQTEHGGIKGELDRPRWPLMRTLHRMLRRSATRYTAVSEDSRRDLIEHGIAHSEEVAVIYNGIDSSRFSFSAPGRDKIREECGLTESNVVIGTVRSLTSKMGIDHLLTAGKELIDKNAEIRLLIVGDGGLRQELGRLSEHLGIQDNVIFLGERRDIADCLSAMDVFVMPSVWETFGIAAVEAMAVGVPVVAYAVGGLTEVVQDGQTGLLVDHRDPNLLADRILEIIDDPKGLGSRLSERAHARVGEAFDVRVAASEYLALYRRLAGEVVEVP